MAIIREFTPTREDLYNACGTALGRGAFRTVFPLGKNVVLKYERTAVANIREYNVWQRVKDTDLARYLVPIYGKSSDGCTLIQARIKATVDYVEHQLQEKCWELESSGEYAKAHKMRSKRSELRDTVRDFAREVYRAFQRVGIDANDLHEGNIGYDYSGRMVVLDYGNFWIQREPYVDGGSNNCSCTECRAERDDDSSERSSDKCPTCGERW